MEKLPQEVFDQIAQLLYDVGTVQDFRNASYVCAGLFRACSELREHEWHKITIRPKNLDTFVALYRSFGRPMLREAAYVLELPEDFDVVWRRAPGEPDALDELVTDQIAQLFRALNTLDEEGLIWRWLRVDIQKPRRLERVITDSAGTRLIHLLRPEELPVVKCIWRLSVGEWYGPYQRGDPYEFALRTPFELLPRLPNLEGFLADVDDAHRCPADLELRRLAAREDLMALLPTLPRPPRLERAVLSFLGREAHKRLDHAVQMPDLVAGAPADPFSLGLGAWCRNLTQLRIHALLDQSFFWPEDGEGVLWPSMELLEVKFHPAAPSGSWYFQGPRGERWNINGGYLVGDPDEHDECTPSQWRTDPVPEVLYPFLTAYARSARRMPRLKSAMIWSPIHWEPSARDDYYVVDGVDYMHHPMNHGDVGWGIGYRAPGTREPPEFWRGRRDVRGDVRQFWWSLAFDGLPGELRDEMHGIGREEHGDGLEDYECTFGDQDPQWFTMFGPDEGNGVGYLP